MSRKKIVILSSLGGAGHASAEKALRDYLSDEYDITVVYPFAQTFKRYDFTRYFVPRRSGEQVYNWFLINRWFFAIKIMYFLGIAYCKIHAKSLTTCMKRQLHELRADLVISVIPLSNGITLRACKELSIPFVVIPTDLVATSFSLGIKNPDYAQFFFTRSFDDQAIQKTLEPAEIPKTQQPLVGFPIRSSFFSTYTISELKKQWAIPLDKPVILLMMGGQGALNIIDYTRALSLLKTQAHIIICIGRADSVRNHIEHIPFQPHLTNTIVSFTEKMAELMALADIIISKSGTVSMCESIYAQKPIILDGTISLLPWERLNHEFIKRHNFGTVITDLAMLAPMVEKLLENPSLYQTYCNALAQFAKKRPDIEIPKLIQFIFSQNTSINAK